MKTDDDNKTFKPLMGFKTWSGLSYELNFKDWFVLYVKARQAGSIPVIWADLIKDGKSVSYAITMANFLHELPLKEKDPTFVFLREEDEDYYKHIGALPDFITNKKVITGRIFSLSECSVEFIQLNKKVFDFRRAGNGK